MAGMKSSTIKTVIRKKLDTWAASIQDSELSKKVLKDSFVTGGCITSMLLSEKVNDYDVYFKTQETALAVAKYYVDLFNKSTDIKLKQRISSCAPEVRVENRTNIKGVSESRVIVYMKSSGVAAEDQGTYAYFESGPKSDQEAFMESIAIQEESEETPDGLSVEDDVDSELRADKIQTVIDVVNDVKNPRSSEGVKIQTQFRPLFLSENAITLSDKVQLVVRFFGNPQKIHENYDFIHCTCWYDYNTDHLELPPAALEAILSKSLIYCGSLYPLCSLFRIRKFLDRGWRITAGQILKISMQISEINLKDRATLYEQIIGVDVAYMHELIRMIETSDQKIDSAYIARLVDEIFE
jgi:hypothetical protein